MIRLLPLLCALPLAAQITATLTPGAGLRWPVEIYGPPGTTIARARILSHVPVGFLLERQAEAALQRQARDSRVSRLGNAGRVGLALCPAASTFALTRIRSHSSQANYATVAAALVGGACALWGVLDARVQADRPDPAADIAALMPDGGVTLDKSGGWSGLLVAAAPGGSAVTVEVK